MHCRDRTVFINNLVIFRRFWKMTRFLKSIIKQKVFILGLWYFKLEIWSKWKVTYSKIRNFHWKDFELLAFEHVRLKMGHTVLPQSKVFEGKFRSCLSNLITYKSLSVYPAVCLSVWLENNNLRAHMLVYVAFAFSFFLKSFNSTYWYIDKRKRVSKFL